MLHYNLYCIEAESDSSVDWVSEKHCDELSTGRRTDSENGIVVYVVKRSFFFKKYGWLNLRRNFSVDRQDNAG